MIYMARQSAATKAVTRTYERDISKNAALVHNNRERHIELTSATRDLKHEEADDEFQAMEAELGVCRAYASCLWILSRR